MLSGRDVASLLAIEECMRSVESAFKMFAEGKTSAPKVLGLLTKTGGLHIRAGIMNLNNNDIVAKMNSIFLKNPDKRTECPIPDDLPGAKYTHEAHLESQIN